MLQEKQHFWRRFYPLKKVSKNCINISGLQGTALLRDVFKFHLNFSKHCIVAKFEVLKTLRFFGLLFKEAPPEGRWARKF